MIVAAVLVIAQLRPHVEHGKLLVQRAQWITVSDELNSNDPDRIARLIDPRAGVSFRCLSSVNGKATRFHWSRRKFLEQVRKCFSYGKIDNAEAHRENPAFYEALALRPGGIYRGIGFRNATIFWDDGAKDRLAPHIYIRMKARGGRLWIKEFGYVQDPE